MGSARKRFHEINNRFRNRFCKQVLLLQACIITKYTFNFFTYRFEFIVNILEVMSFFRLIQKTQKFVKFNSNPGHNFLERSTALCEAELDMQQKKINVRVASRVVKCLKVLGNFRKLHNCVKNSCLLSRNRTLAQAIKYQAKADINFLWSYTILIYFFTVCRAILN